MIPKKWRLVLYIISSVFFTIGIITYYLVFPTITVNAAEFQKKGNYSRDTLLLFVDIAFPYDRIRKWNGDIKVEIVNEDKLDKESISDVDSIIHLLSPLIQPVKIYRVAKDGNLIVRRKVDSVPNTTNDAQGFCYIPPLIKTLSWNIKYAEVYDIWYSPVIFHEFLHAIGLQHPSKEYPFYMTIDGGHTFESLEDAEVLYNHLYISEEEKTIIKMLYSPYIKSGLRKEEFIKKMKLQDNVN